ncbi:Vacuolar basic amino acid transporter 1, partial [Leucoagaricus sp. SymC.cos]
TAALQSPYCTLVVQLDSAIVATSTISADFNVGSVASWVPSAYLLTSICFQPLHGYLSDIFGRKATSPMTMFIFMGGNLARSFSRTITMLMVFRGVSGVGGSMNTLVQITVSDILSLRERGKYQGIMGVAMMTGIAIALAVGGALIQHASWQVCLSIKAVPVSIWALLVVAFVLPLKIVQGSTKDGFLMYSAVFNLPQLFQVVLGYSPLSAGLFLIPMTAGQILVNQTAVGLMTSQSKTGEYQPMIYLGFSLWSIAHGLISTITPQAKANVPREDMAVVTAFRNMNVKFVRLLGGTLAQAVGASLINNTIRLSMQELSFSQETITSIIANLTPLLYSYRGKHQAIIGTVVATGWCFMVPLDLIPLYSANSWPNKFWHFQRNTTEWSIMMRELVLSGNALAKLMLQDLAPKLHGAHIGLFDSHSFFADMHAHPTNYLNGTAPFNVTGAVNTCVFQVGDSNDSVCTLVNGTDRDSYLCGIMTFSIMFYLPQFFQVALGYTPLLASVFLIPTLLRLVDIEYESNRLMFVSLTDAYSSIMLQTTTVAAQASVPRKDMAVVTAFRNVSKLILPD